MIHIRSFRDLPPEAGRKGKAFSIANSTPNRVKADGTIECLVPPLVSRALLHPETSRLAFFFPALTSLTFSAILGGDLKTRA